MDTENEGVENEALPTYQKWYWLRDPHTINYNYRRSNLVFMVCNNLIVFSHALHNVTKANVNILNAIFIFVDPNTPTNIITNDTTLTQYIIKQGLKGFVKKGEATLRK